ncbi:MFS transporter [Herbaspirillum huttiense]|uniref:MFS transporter n=2 Tax=Herbaspirillum huttiense TaxID=863372 RepID=A0AAJ2H7J6_9BURK|nr:MFS transporter [Herbaspirillum huttiense]MDR9835386.1 MFS transporter [Herbaspirillum huttiense]
MTRSSTSSLSPGAATAAAGWGELLGPHRWRAVALTGGVALYAINVHIVTTILPSVVRDIGGLAYYAWNVTLFVAASIAGSALTGKLMGALGARATYLMALALFGSGALLCGSAGSMGWMLAGRAVQGIGGGLLAALAYALIPLVFEPRMWPRAIALVSGMWGVSTLLGPAVGGLFAASGHWRVAFFALLPLLAAQAWLVWRQLGPATVRGASGPAQAVPLGRIALLASSVVLVALAAQADDDWLASACVLAGVLLAVWMARIDLRHRANLLPHAAYRPRTVMGGVMACIALLVMGSCVEIFLPYFLQNLHGYDPLGAGYATAAMAAGWSLGSLGGSGLSGRAALRMIRLGPCMMTLGMALLAFLMPAQWLPAGALADALIVLALGATGLGIGMGWPHLVARALHAAQPGEENLTSSAITTVQLFAMALGAALAGLVANQAGLGAGGAEATARAAWVLLALFTLAPALAIFVARSVARDR